MKTDICPICRLDDQEETNPGGRDTSVITCERCGKYMMVDTILPKFKHMHTHGVQSAGFTLEDVSLLPYLSAYTRQTYESGKTAQLDSKNWRDCARQHSNTPEEQKLFMLLCLMKERTRIPGHMARLNCNLDYPLVDAASREECFQILENLKDRNLLDYIHETAASYLVTLNVAGRQFLEEKSSQVIGEMDFEAVPEASRQDLTKAADRYTRGDLSGALAAACAAVDSACARVYKEKGLGDPAKVPSFQQKVIKSLDGNGAFQRLESELATIGWNSDEAHRLAQNLKGSLNQATNVMQSLRSRMSDAHGSKPALEAVVFDSLKWATIIASQLR